MVLLGDLEVNGVGVAAEVENVGDVSIFDKDTGDCVTADDGVVPENEELSVKLNSVVVDSFSSFRKNL